jgi:hypothetical protein
MSKGKETKIKLWKNFSIGFEVELEIDVTYARSNDLFGETIDEDEDDYNERISEGFADYYDGPNDPSNVDHILKFFDDPKPQLKRMNYLASLRELAKNGVKFEPAEDCKWGDPCVALGSAGAMIFIVRKILSRHKQGKGIPFIDFLGFSRVDAIGEDFNDVFGNNPDVNKLRDVINSLTTRLEKHSLKASKSEEDFLNKVFPESVAWVEDVKKIRDEIEKIAGEIPFGDYIATPLWEEFDNSRIPVSIISNRGKLYPITGLQPFGALKSYVETDYTQAVGYPVKEIPDIGNFLILMDFTRGDDTLTYQDFLEYYSSSYPEKKEFVHQVVGAIGAVRSNSEILEELMLEIEDGAREEYESQNPINRVEVEINNEAVVEHMRNVIEGHPLEEYIDDIKADDSLKAGVEIITYPFGVGEKNPATALKKALDFVEDLNDFLRSNPEFMTTSSTGFHINIGTFPKAIFKQSGDRPPLASRFDILKLLVFLGERNALEIFNRNGNQYAYPIIGQMSRNEDFISLMVGEGFDSKFDKLRQKLQRALYDVKEKRRTVNLLKLEQEYLEFRFAGNVGYENPQKVKEALRRIILAIAAALDPVLFRNDYLKKLTIMADNYRQTGESRSEIVDVVNGLGPEYGETFGESLKTSYRKGRPSALLDNIPNLISKIAMHKLNEGHIALLYKYEKLLTEAVRNNTYSRGFAGLMALLDSKDEDLIQIAEDSADLVRAVVEKLFPLSQRAAAFRKELPMLKKFRKPGMLLIKRAFLTGDKK